MHPLLTPAIDFDIDDTRAAFEANTFGVMAVTKAFSRLLVLTAAAEKNEYVRIAKCVRRDSILSDHRSIGSSAGSGQVSRSTALLL